MSLSLGEVSVGALGVIGFQGIYSCTSAVAQVVVTSICGFGSSPPGPWKKAHLGCGVGFGWADDTHDVSDFEGWSYGAFMSVGAGAGLTGFVEGHSPLRPDTFGFVVGPGAGFSAGPLACKAWAWEL